MTDRTARVDTVVLDIDGTLVDSNYHHVVAWSRAFRSVGHDVPGWRIHRALGMGGDRLVAQVAGQEVEESAGDAVRAAWEKEYDAMLDEPVAFDGAPELLAELRRRGLRVVLASSAIPRHASRSIELLGEAREHADATTTSEDAEETKPDPELLETAVERVDGSSSIVVGDAVWDVEAAHRFGVPAVALLSGGVGEGELRSAGAAWVFRDVQELQERLDTVLTPVGDLA
jgi:HAD superfamily hydrolase (TIGR01549 family)